MTTAKPLARYSAIRGALASGFATDQLHHLRGPDPGGSAQQSRQRAQGSGKARRGGRALSACAPVQVAQIMECSAKAYIGPPGAITTLADFCERRIPKSLFL